MRILQKLKRAGVALACCAAVAVPLCTSRGTAVTADAAAGAKLWTTYNTYAVLRDPADMQTEKVSPPKVLTEGTDLSLDVLMGRGEDEGAQLVITAENAIGSYLLETNGDLSDGAGHTIPADNIKIYHQYYWNIPANALFGDYVPQGDYPNIMIPMATAAAYGENKIAAGKNQGISVEVRSDVDTVPGTYTGSLKLTLDGEVTSVPVNVTVRDVDLSKSEFKIIGASTETLSTETYEMLMDDFRVMCQFMPEATFTPAKMVEQLRTYFDDPRFACYELPNTTPAAFGQFLDEVARACGQDGVDYLSKACAYMQSLDETTDYAHAASVVANYKAQKTEVKNKLASYIQDTDLRTKVSNSIDGIALYIPILTDGHTPSVYNVDIKGSDVTWCFGMGGYPHGEEYVAEFVSSSATQPLFYSNNPFPQTATAHPNYGQGTRAMGWSGAQNNFAGALLWDVDETKTEVTSRRGTAETYRPRNYYDDANSWSTTYGNGALVIPAKRYGDPTGWFATLRVRNMRDAVEDYSLIGALEEKYDELKEHYGVTGLDFDKQIKMIYDRVQGKPYTYLPDDCTGIYEARAAIFDLIDLANSSEQVMLAGGGMEADNTDVTFYAETSAAVKVNGTAVSPDGKKYTRSYKTNDSADLTVTIGDEDVFGFGVNVFGDIKGSFATSGITAENVKQYAEGSPASLGDYIPAGEVSFDGTKLKIDISSSEGKDTLQSMGYFPQATLKAKLFGTENLFDVCWISMKMRVKFDGAGENDVIPMCFTAGDRMNANRTDDVLWTSEHNVGDGWRERTIIIWVDRPINNLKTTGSLTIELKSNLHGDTYNKGAHIEISDIYYGNYPFGRKEA